MTAVGKAPRRMRAVEEKVAIVAQTLAPGVSVAAVARQHGVNANLLFAWRRLHEQGLLADLRRRIGATEPGGAVPFPHT